jgi:hypothetical protein
MSEITYHWLGGKKAVDVSPDVQLPQFHVLGYRQGYRVEALTTGLKFEKIKIGISKNKKKKNLKISWRK